MGTFDFQVNVVWGDYESAQKYVAYKFEDEETDLTTYDKGYTPRGKCFHRTDFCPIVWVPGVPKTPREIATLAHEMFHAVCLLMDWASVPLTTSSEEVYAHAQAHLVTEALTAMKKL